MAIPFGVPSEGNQPWRRIDGNNQPRIAFGARGLLQELRSYYRRGLPEDSLTTTIWPRHSCRIDPISRSATLLRKLQATSRVISRVIGPTAGDSNCPDSGRLASL